MSSNNRSKANEGDWICSDLQCGNVNFARREACNRCNKEKNESYKKKKLGHEIGKAAAEKSRGLFSADDWQCNKCGNVNWARRQTCNMCNAPKYGEIEERTGYGGGYNDRGVVEYVQRSDSDDEYDEFGRRRRKKNFNSVKQNVSKEKNYKEENDDDEDCGRRSHQDDDEEEEDDDDEEDEDLSKYDLVGEIEDKKCASDQDKEQCSKDGKFQSRSKSRSRTRSRSPVYIKGNNNSRSNSSSPNRSRSARRRSNS